MYRHLTNCMVPLWSAAAMAMCMQVASVQAEEVRYPDDAGVVNVKTQYGAVGDGVTDDTEALQRAVRELSGRTGRMLYFPNGTYLIRDSLAYRGEPSGLVLQGQSEEGVIIRLADRSPGFDDPKDPRPVINMLDRAPTNVVYGNGFAMYLRNLTIEVGAGNPGATGIRFLANNTGGIRHVTIRSVDPQRTGVAAIICDRRAAGPAFLQHITLEGFNYGVRATVRGYNLVFENLTLRHQNVAGIQAAEPYTIRGLVSENRVPVAVIPPGGHNQHRFAQYTIIDGQFRGGDPEQPAIRNGSFVFLRDVKADGYARLVENTHADTPNLDALHVDEYVSDVAHSLFPTQLRTLRLPVKETPQPPHDPIENWVRVGSENVRREHWAHAGPRGTDFVFVGNGCELLQNAIDKAAAEGKHTVYIANLGKPGERTHYYVSRPIRIHGSVRRIVGLGNTIEVSGGVRERGLSVFVIAPEVTSDTIWIEQLQMSPGAEGRQWNFTVIDHQADATLVLRSMGFPSGFAYKSSGRGEVFIEGVVGANWQFGPGQRVWARQFNTEDWDVQTQITGGDLWVLGLKTEQEGLVLRAKDSRVEILGGFLTPSHTVRLQRIPEDRPAFELIDTQASINIQFAGGLPRTQYMDLVRETRNGVTRRAPLVAFPLWGGWGGGTIQLYSSMPLEAPRGTDGFALREFWHADNAPEAIDDRDAVTIPPLGRTHPSAVVMPMVHGGFQPPAQLGSGYVERYRFFVQPPVSGEYHFELAGTGRRDEAHLWVSPDGNPDNARKVEWRSNIALDADREAYVEIMSRRFDSHNRIRVGWRLPDGTLETPIPGTRLVNAITP
jgi:hypothetical protein